MKLVADDVQGLIIPDCGHWLAEEAPEQMLAALTAFLGPYRDAPRRITEHRAVVARSRTAACYERVTHLPGADRPRTTRLTPYSRRRWGTSLPPLPVRAWRLRGPSPEQRRGLRRVYHGVRLPDRHAVRPAQVGSADGRTAERVPGTDPAGAGR